MFSRWSRGSDRQAVSDDEKAAIAYEGGNEKRSRFSAFSRKSGPAPSTTSSNRWVGSFAPNPLFIRLLRFLLYGLTSLVSLATAGVGLGVVQYYNAHEPVIKPSWGSLIAVIVFGIGTPGVLFGTFFVTPYLFRYGSPLGIVNQTRTELLSLFAVSAVWISGALALACDLRGTEFCLWDGYYHYPKPSDYNHVCNLRNVTVALAYTTFGMAALTMSVVYAFAIYILLFLDQEVLTEQTNDMGGRAYRARVHYLAQERARAASRPTSQAVAPGVGATNANEIPNSRRSASIVSRGGANREPSSRRVPVPEVNDVEQQDPFHDGNAAYYGYDQSPSRNAHV